MEINALAVLIFGGLAFFPAVALLDRQGPRLGRLGKGTAGRELRRRHHSSKTLTGA